MKSIRLFELDEQNKRCLSDITEEFYIDKFREFSNKAIQCIMLDDAYVGWVHTDVPSNSLYSGFVFIYINPNYRRKGIATKVYRMAEKEFLEAGCNWWSSCPEYDVADKFAMSVGFTYTNTNSHMVFSGSISQPVDDDIRACRPDDYPVAPDI